MQSKRKLEMKADDNITGNDEPVMLSSSHSTQVSLDDVKHGRAGLNKRRKGLLERVPNQNDNADFPPESLEMKDLAYLTAKTGDEFAILRGKDRDVLWHGTPLECKLLPKYKDELKSHKLELYGHSHPGELFPDPSADDRRFLRYIGQKRSKIISGMTGICVEFEEIP